MSTFTYTAADSYDALHSGFRSYNRDWNEYSSIETATQGYYAGYEGSTYDDRIGIISFNGASILKGKKINSIILTITTNGSGVGTWANKNLIIRKSMIQGLSNRKGKYAIDYAGDLTNADTYASKILTPDNGKTAYDYDSNILGILTGPFRANTTTHTLNSSTNKDLFNHLKDYLENGNDTIVIYNSCRDRMWYESDEEGNPIYRDDGVRSHFSYELLGITSMTISVNYLIPYNVTLNAGDGSFKSGSDKVQQKTITKWESTSLVIPDESEYVPTRGNINTSFRINGTTFLDSSDNGDYVSQVATKSQVFSFETWNTEEDGSGINYDLGSLYTLDRDLTLYAMYSHVYEYSNNVISGSKWWNISKPDELNNTYTVTFDGNGGTCSVSSLSSDKITKYTFDGWYSERNGVGIKYDNTSAFESQIQMYANWTSITVTAPIVLPPSDTVYRKGYEFINWNQSPSGTGDFYIAGTEYIPTSSMTLYAFYKAKGLAGLNIDKTWEKSLVWVFDGTEWRQVIPWIFNGTNWKIGG